MLLRGAHEKMGQISSPVKPSRPQTATCSRLLASHGGRLTVGTHASHASSLGFTCLDIYRLNASPPKLGIYLLSFATRPTRRCQVAIPPSVYYFYQQDDSAPFLFASHILRKTLSDRMQLSCISYLELFSAIKLWYTAKLYYHMKQFVHHVLYKKKIKIKMIDNSTFLNLQLSTSHEIIVTSLPPPPYTLMVATSSPLHLLRTTPQLSPSPETLSFPPSPADRTSFNLPLLRGWYL